MSTYFLWIIFTELIEIIYNECFCSITIKSHQYLCSMIFTVKFVDSQCEFCCGVKWKLNTKIRMLIPSMIFVLSWKIVFKLNLFRRCKK